MIAAFSKAFTDIKIEIIDVIGGPDKAAVPAVITDVTSQNGSGLPQPVASFPFRSMSSTPSRTVGLPTPGTWKTGWAGLPRWAWPVTN